MDPPTLSRLAARIGADVPFFLVGGTALGLGRGDDIYPLVDLPRTDVVIVRPQFGVATVEAYGWFDNEPRRAVRETGRRGLPQKWPEWATNLRNDLEPAVTRHHPTIARIKHALARRRRGLRGDVGLGIGGLRPVRSPRRRAPDRDATLRAPAGMWSPPARCRAPSTGDCSAPCLQAPEARIS